MMTDYYKRLIKRIHYMRSKKSFDHYFIHVPKTGGTYIGQFESSSNTVIESVCQLGHRVISTDSQWKKDITLDEYRFLTYGLIRKKRPLVIADRNKIFFSAVRNPYLWLVSYAGHAGAWDTPYINSRHKDYSNAQKGFDYLVEAICDRDNMWPSRRFLFNQFFSLQSEFLLSDVLFTESLDEGLYLYASKYNLKYAKKEKQRVGTIVDYRRLYGDRLICLVEDAFSRELDMFGYSFQDANSKYGSILECDKFKNLRYDWVKDELSNV